MLAVIAGGWLYSQRSISASCSRYPGWIHCARDAMHKWEEDRLDPSSNLASPNEYYPVHHILGRGHGT